MCVILGIKLKASHLLIHTLQLRYMSSSKIKFIFVLLFYCYMTDHTKTVFFHIDYGF